MYPFDIEAYFQKRDVEDTYIVVHLVLENISIEIMQRQTKD